MSLQKRLSKEAELRDTPYIALQMHYVWGHTEDTVLSYDPNCPSHVCLGFLTRYIMGFWENPKDQHTANSTF